MLARQETQQPSTLDSTMAHTKLLESILNGDYNSANELFEERMVELQEKKLYEFKRSIQLSEVVTPVKGKPGQFKGQNTAKDWAKYREQHPSFGMYDVPTKTGKPKKSKPPSHEKTASGGLTAKGIAVRKKKGYVQAHPEINFKYPLPGQFLKLIDQLNWKPRKL